MRDRFLPTIGPLALLALLTCGCGEASGKLLGGQLPGKEIPSWEGEIDEPTASELRVGRCGDGVAQVELIDDMEDGDAKVIPIAGRINAWFSFNDRSDGGMQVPAMGTSLFQMFELDPARGASKLAMHTFGSGYGGWGAGVGFDFLVQSPYDARHYAGVGFWARLSGSTTSLAMRMNINDLNTSPLGRRCDVDCQQPDSSMRTDDVENGVCDSNRGACFDEFGAELGDRLATEWRFFKFPWSALKPVNWSMRNLTNLAIEGLYGVRFQTAKNQVFDFWIDDVYFLCPLGK